MLLKIDDITLSRFGSNMKIPMINISIPKQSLSLLFCDQVLKAYPISTSQYGVGCKSGSNKTPLGLHRVVSKIGRNVPVGGVFRRRRFRGKIARIFHKPIAQRLDQITTRILRLEGLEEGRNRGEGVDTYRRCVYIHGTPEEWLIGKLASHGCIRMRNKDIVELFSLVKRGILVRIQSK